MISRTKLKDLATYRIAKRCEADGVFVVEGVKMAAEALGSKAEILCVCGTSQWLGQNDGVTHSRVSDQNIFEISAADLTRLSNQKSPNNVWMLLKRPEKPNLSDTFNCRTLVLDKIQDPGNLGTIIRTADWFGIRHIVCSHDTVDCYNPKVVQSTMGGIFRTKVTYTDITEWLSHCGTPVYGAVLGGENLTRQTLLTKPCALVIGNESKGICPAVAQQLTQQLTIPNIGGTAESLNAASAAAILIAMMTVEIEN